MISSCSVLRVERIGTASVIEINIYPVISGNRYYIRISIVIKIAQCHTKGSGRSRRLHLFRVNKGTTLSACAPERNYKNKKREVNISHEYKFYLDKYCGSDKN